MKKIQNAPIMKLTVMNRLKQIYGEQPDVYVIREKNSRILVIPFLGPSVYSSGCAHHPHAAALDKFWQFVEIYHHWYWVHLYYPGGNHCLQY